MEKRLYLVHVTSPGAVQRLYVLRGYVPDARGVTAHGLRMNWGDDVKIDDDLVLWLTRTLL